MNDAALATGAQGDIKEEDLSNVNGADETDGLLHRHVKVGVQNSNSLTQYLFRYP